MENVTSDKFDETDEDTFLAQPEDEQLKLSDNMAENLTEEEDKGQVIPKLHNTFDNEYILRNEIHEMMKAVHQTMNIAQSWKTELRHFYNLDYELRRLYRGQPLKQPGNCLESKWLLLEEKSKNLEDTLIEQFALLQEKVNVIALAVKGLQKERNTLLTQKKICDTEHLKLLNTKKSTIYYLPKTTETQNRQALHVDCIPYPENRFRTLVSKQLEMKNKLLRDSSRRLERKDELIDEKGRQYEELRRSMSQLVPAEKLMELPESKRIIKEQSKTIQELTACVAMYRQKAEELKRDKEKLIKKFEASRELYPKNKKNLHP